MLLGFSCKGGFYGTLRTTIDPALPYKDVLRLTQNVERGVKPKKKWCLLKKCSKIYYAINFCKNPCGQEKGVAW